VASVRLITSEIITFAWTGSEWADDVALIVTRDDEVLVVLVIGSQTPPTEVRWDGAVISYQDDRNDQNVGGITWFDKIQPEPGAYNLTVVNSSGGSRRLIVLGVGGVELAAPRRLLTKAPGWSASPDISCESRPGDLVVAVVSTENVHTHDAGQNPLTTSETASGEYAGSAYWVATSQSTSFGWSQAASNTARMAMAYAAVPIFHPYGTTRRLSRPVVDLIKPAHLNVRPALAPPEWRRFLSELHAVAVSYDGVVVTHPNIGTIVVPPDIEQAPYGEAWGASDGTSKVVRLATSRHHQYGFSVIALVRHTTLSQDCGIWGKTSPDIMQFWWDVGEQDLGLQVDGVASYGATGLPGDTDYHLLVFRYGPSVIPGTNTGEVWCDGKLLFEIDDSCGSSTATTRFNATATDDAKDGRNFFVYGAEVKYCLTVEEVSALSADPFGPFRRVRTIPVARAPLPGERRWVRR